MQVLTNLISNAAKFSLDDGEVEISAEQRGADAQVGELGALLDGFGDLRSLGSAALDLCMVADGSFDAFVERGLHEHDVAAGALIAEEAGVVVSRPRLRSVLDGGPTEVERLAAITVAGPADLVGSLTGSLAGSAPDVSIERQS